MNEQRDNKLKPITIFRGLPGSGKSKRLIEMVQAANATGQPVLTFACSDSPWMQTRDSIRVDGLLGCRQAGLTCRLDHFVSPTECAAILEHVPAGTLVAFEEAHYFPLETVPHWVQAAQRGLEVLICMPSNPQLQLLREQPHTETNFAAPCEQCGKADAKTFVILPGRDATLLLCAECDRAKMAEARTELVERLQRQAPYPGEKVIYQPVELEECADWKVLRPDSPQRVEIMTRIIGEFGVISDPLPGGVSYLDVGCNTGYFCHRMRQLGFFSEGVDVVKEDILVAQILDSYIRRSRSVFVAKDAYGYLHDTQGKMFDVTSAFAVFQWLMIQTNAERGISCLEWLFAKTRRICFLEMGYSEEAQYKGKLPITIDRAWVENIMREKGRFAEVRLFRAGEEHGLMRDLFVGIQRPDLWFMTKAVRQCIPRDATVLVVSKGDEWLLKLEGRRAWHFPQGERGVYCGHHPANSAEAIARLEAQRAQGGQFLAFPATALWWLDFYAEFRQHLDQHYRRVFEDVNCVIYQLALATGQTAVRSHKAT